MDERWYATRSVGTYPDRKTYRLRAQPPDGFGDVGQVLDWLIEQGFVRIVPDARSDDGFHREGWGTEFFASAGCREDEWEPPHLVLVPAPQALDEWSSVDEQILKAMSDRFRIE